MHENHIFLVPVYVTPTCLLLGHIMCLDLNKTIFLFGIYSIITYILYNILGGAYRKCLQNVQWGEPDVSECRTPEVVQLEMEAESLLTVDGDVGESVTSETVIDITDELSSILNTSQPIFPNDLSSITNILDVVIL